jgi:hypothetical protein
VYSLQQRSVGGLNRVPAPGLAGAIEERITDRHLVNLVRAMLRAGVMRTGRSRAAIPERPRVECFTMPGQRLSEAARQAVG